MRSRPANNFNILKYISTVDFSESDSKLLITFDKRIGNFDEDFKQKIQEQIYENLPLKQAALLSTNYRDKFEKNDGIKVIGLGFFTKKSELCNALQNLKLVLDDGRLNPDSEVAYVFRLSNKHALLLLWGYIRQMERQLDNLIIPVSINAMVMEYVKFVWNAEAGHQSVNSQETSQSVTKDSNSHIAPMSKANETSPGGMRMFQSSAGPIAQEITEDIDKLIALVAKIPTSLGLKK
jgi:hypothetical protein